VRAEVLIPHFSTVHLTLMVMVMVMVILMMMMMVCCGVF
jgi:hypothetical protein